MSLRFHEIAESNHRILNPFTHEKLMLLGEVCRLQPHMRQLDLACGKAEMLCQWSSRWGVRGVGVDISAVFLAAAAQRAAELDVADRISLLQGDAGAYRPDAPAFDVVSCIGATWIGGGLTGTLALMEKMLRPDGLALVGEPYITEAPPREAYAAMGIGEGDYLPLLGTLDRIESAGFELVEMVLSDADSWDRYAAAQWITVDDWLRANPDDPDAAALRGWITDSKRAYMAYQRRYLGWGVFVMRHKA